MPFFVICDDDASRRDPAGVDVQCQIIEAASLMDAFEQAINLPRRLADLA